MTWIMLRCDCSSSGSRKLWTVNFPNLPPPFHPYQAFNGEKWTGKSPWMLLFNNTENRFITILKSTWILDEKSSIPHPPALGLGAPLGLKHVKWLLIPLASLADLYSFSSLGQILYRMLAGFSEKAIAPHSSTLAWKIPWMEEPGRLQSMGLLRVGHDWVTSLSLFTFMHWRRKWQPTPVFLPGESQGQGSLVGCRLWGRTESDTTEVT